MTWQEIAAESIGATFGVGLGLYIYWRWIGPTMRRIDHRIADWLGVPHD